MSNRSTFALFFVFFLALAVGCEKGKMPLESDIVFYGVTLGDSSGSVALTNVGDADIDVKDWYVSSSADPAFTRFPEGSVIVPNAISGWSSDFFPFDLYVPGITLYLNDPNGVVVDSLTP